MQKIRSDAITSFSILGLGILLGLGGLVILVSMTIDSLAGWVGKRLGIGNYQRLEWVSNGTLQLQRLAHEELGCGSWTGEDFPITTADESLALLDISEPDHPKLMNPALTHISMPMVNASLPLIGASLPVADTSSSIADASSPVADTSSPMVNASPPLMEASSTPSLADVSSQ